ncbi:MAG: helix-turn-helix transcriptional regulator [Gallionella sp.]|jgi:transcriptional regulator with XRE-family HTH domain
MTDDTIQGSTQSSQQQDTDTHVETIMAVAAPEESFPERLAALRSEKSLRHDSLSELTKHVDPQKRGIARTTLRGYELGVTKPGIRELRILSQALGVSTNQLIFGTDEVDSVFHRGDFVVERPTLLGKTPEEITNLARFLVAMYKVGDQERDAVYKVAASLASSKLGEVEYRKLMDLTQELVETYFDVHAENIPKGQLLKPEYAQTMIETFAPLLDATFSKFGIEFSRKPQNKPTNNRE